MLESKYFTRTFEETVKERTLKLKTNEQKN